MTLKSLALAMCWTGLLVTAAAAQHDPRVALPADMLLAAAADPEPVMVAESATPAAAAEDYTDFVPPPGFRTAGDVVPDTELVKRLFVLGYADQCSWVIGGSALGIDPEVWDLSYRDSFQEADEPDRTFRLYRFNCDFGAYNVISVFLTWDDFSGLKPLAFATPDYVVDYKDGDYDGEVLGITTGGMVATNTLTNAWFDPETATIGSFSKWRGMADASSGGRWVQSGPNFVLESFDVDGSYDGEINPLRIIAGGKLLDVPEQMTEDVVDARGDQDNSR